MESFVFPGVLLLWAFAAVVGLGLFAFWIWALVDCLTREFHDPLYKIMWVVVIIFLHFLGALLYVLIGRSQGYRR